jgi:hypothetical protein
MDLFCIDLYTAEGVPATVSLEVHEQGLCSFCDACAPLFMGVICAAVETRGAREPIDMESWTGLGVAGAVEMAVPTYICRYCLDAFFWRGEVLRK